MSVTGLLSSLRRSVAKKHQQSRKPASFSRGRFRPSFRPCFEILEDRLVLTPPTLAADPTFMSLTSISALLGGDITANGGLGIQQRGVVYSNTASIQNPTIEDATTHPDQVKVLYGPTNIPDLGQFLVTVGNLTPNHTYYFRAFATSGTLAPNLETAYTANHATFTTNPGSVNENRIIMPDSTVTISQADMATYLNKIQDPSLPHTEPFWAEINKVLFLGPTPGQTITYSNSQGSFLPGQTKPVPNLPLKTVTFTNNLRFTVYTY